MKRLICFLLLLLAALPIYAQTVHVFPALDTNNAFTGYDSFLQFVAPQGTYAAMIASHPAPYSEWLLTNAGTAGSCAAGGGGYAAWCAYINGSWIGIGGGGGGGQSSVYMEWLPPLFSTPCPLASGTPCTDIIPAPFVVNPSYVLRGPPSASYAASNVIQDVSCRLSSVGPVPCVISQPLPGSFIVASISTVEGTDIADTFTVTDSNSDTYTGLDTVCAGSCSSGNSPWADAYWKVPAAGVTGYLTVTGTPANTNANYATLMHVREVAGVSAIHAHAGGGSISSSTISFPSVGTASGSNFVVSDGFGFNDASVQTYAPSGSYGATEANNASVLYSVGPYFSLASQGAVISGSGTQTPQATASASEFLQGGSISFTRSGLPNGGAYYFGFYRYPDLCAGGDFPCPGTLSNNQSLRWNSTTQNWQAFTAASGSGVVNAAQQYLLGCYLSSGSTAAISGCSNITTDSSGDLIVTDGSGTRMKISVADGSITTYLSNHSTVALPYLAGSIGTDTVPGTGYLGFFEGSDNLMHEGSGGTDLGDLCTTSMSCITLAGNSGDLQTNNGSGALGASHLNDNGTTLTLSESLTARVAAAVNLGTSALPFGDGYFGNAANQAFHFTTSALTALRAVAVQDAASTITTTAQAAQIPSSAPTGPLAGGTPDTAATAHQMALPLQCADTSSSSTTYTCTTTPSLGSLTKGDAFTFTSINQNNSGSSTLNIDTIGAKTIKKWQNTANLASGDLQAGATVTLIYDGTYLEVDTIGNAPAGGTVTTSGSPSSLNPACFSSSTAITNCTLNGSGNVVATTSPALTTPSLGAATATSLLASGIIDGTAPITLTTGSSASLGGTYASGYTYNQEATAATAITYTLPTAAAGKQYCIANSQSSGTPDTGTLKLATSASGQYIEQAGTLSTSGGYIISGGAAGDAACVVGESSTVWMFYPQSGTWTLH